VTASETRDLVRRRAADRCEYCQLRQDHSPVTHHVEHIVAKQHGGSDEPDNLALACHRCNLRKGRNLTGIDPLTNQVVELFHPRRDQWRDHFSIRGVRIEGSSPAGRATVQVLAMNDARRLDLRQELLIRGDFP
jgi:hypothetical protein